MANPGTYHHGDLRAAILAAAIEIAEKEGVSAISIRAIARQLGVSHAAPARHFANRADLLAGLATEAFSLFADELERSNPAAATGRARLSALGATYIRFALRRPALFRLMFHPEATDHATAPNPALQAAADRAYAVLTSTVQSAMGSRASDVEVENATRLAWSAAHGAAMLWLDGPLRDMGKRNFMQWAEASMDQISQSIVRR